ncbi:MAG TPA: MlaD family protein [Candidatus Acidoferrum sp.]|nr:MlaD family protein [Candidatus Acidoferrum sp.]
MAEITIRISDKALKAMLAVLSAVALLLAFFYLGSLGVFRPKYEIKTFVPEVNGLGVGALVRLNGVPVGSVSKIELANNSIDSNRRIELTLRIEKRYDGMIRDDSTAALVTDGLLGSRYVNILGSLSGMPINSGQEIRTIPTKELQITDLGNAINKLADCLNREKKAPNEESRSDANKPPPNQHANP